jgi:hypothetical protein
MLLGMRNPPGDGDDDYAAAASSFRAAWRRLVDAMQTTREPQDHFDRATETGEMLSKLVIENGEERAAAAVRIQESERLTLTALSERISMSKQRAGRLTEKARRPRKDQD